MIAKLFVFLMLFTPAFTDADNPDKFKGQPSYAVDRVIDGDTVVLAIDGKRTTVRLIGVDTPETVHPNKPVQRYGREASAFTKRLLTGKRVFMEREPGSNTKDRYGRELAYLYLETGLLVNKEIISKGYGFAYTKYPFGKMEDFRKAEAQAREAKVGLWADEDQAHDQAPPATKPRPEKPPTSKPSPSGYCGAITKKGTPCKRRVRDGGRCYQHRGT